MLSSRNKSRYLAKKWRMYHPMHRNMKMDVAALHSNRNLSVYSLETFKSRSNAGESNVKPF